ncbi:MAG: class I SAM-dependent methyltransferase [Armatimonadota bacterium]|nr:class I SAM-dependent methyltransferase [bacterium]
MTETPAWYYDEFKQIGTDYEYADEVRRYDERMHTLRDIPKETADTIALLGIGPESTLVEFGCGTGELAITAAGLCRKVHAVDISQVMIDYAHAKAETRGVNSVEFHRAGFLTYEHSDEPADIVVTQLALHHLPDFWKVVALGRIRDILKPGGRFFLRDVVFSFDLKNYRKALDAWIDTVKECCGSVNCRNHIRDEYSTTSWLMEAMLQHTGFDIISADYTGGVFAAYLCEKI